MENECFAVFASLLLAISAAAHAAAPQPEADMAPDSLVFVGRLLFRGAASGRTQATWAATHADKEPGRSCRGRPRPAACRAHASDAPARIT